MALKFGLSQIGIAPPKIWMVISRTLRAFSAGAIVMVQNTSILPHKTSDTITWILGAIMLLIQSIDIGLGDSNNSPSVPVTTITPTNAQPK